MSAGGVDAGIRAGSIAAIFSRGEIADGHRSRDRAKALLADFKRTLDMPAGYHKLDNTMLDFIIEVVLGAAWYQKRYLGARWELRRYIALNCIAVIGLPISLIGLLWLGKDWLHYTTTGMVASQLMGVLTGILALQKMLSSWYASQRRFAAWYKSASDLKTLYYSFTQKWEGNVAKDELACHAALMIAASSARQIIASEQLDYFQKLALPSFDILDMLTSARSTVSALVATLLPGVQPATVVTAGKNVVAATALSTTPRAVPGPGEFAITPGGRVPRSSVYRVAPGATLSFNTATPALSPGVNPGASAISNWITYASCNTDGKSIVSFRTTWIVPPGPFLSKSQTIFLFNGAQTADGNTILQPVLQWGDSYLDGENQDDIGPFWAIASWAVVNGNRHITHHQRVPVGQMLIGVIILEQQTDAGYRYSCEFKGIDGTKLVVTLPSPLVNCVEVLEAYEQSIGEATAGYELFDRQEYPNAVSIDFTDIDVMVASGGAVGTWTSTTCVSGYGENTTIVANAATNGAVSIVIPLETS
jgi:hypothetical protein